MIDDAGHCLGDAEVDFVDGNENTNPTCWRKGRVGEYALQTTGLLLPRGRESEPVA
jgi:hypothetical protein